MLKFGEIGLCNLVLRTKRKKNNKRIELKEVVFSQPYSKIKTELKVNDFEDIFIIHKAELEEDLIIESIEVLVALGYKQKTKQFTEVKQNDNNNRNKITGAYE